MIFRLFLCILFYVFLCNFWLIISWPLCTYFRYLFMYILFLVFICIFLWVQVLPYLKFYLKLFFCVQWPVTVASFCKIYLESLLNMFVADDFFCLTFSLLYLLEKTLPKFSAKDKNTKPLSYLHVLDSIKDVILLSYLIFISTNNWS